MVIFHAALLLPHLHKLELRRCQTNQEGKLALLHVNSSDWESHTKFGKELGELIFELPWSILSRLTPCYHFMGRVPITHCCSHHVYFPIAYFYLLQTKIFKRSISKQCPQALLPPPIRSSCCSQCCSLRSSCSSCGIHSPTNKPFLLVAKLAPRLEQPARNACSLICDFDRRYSVWKSCIQAHILLYVLWVA